ncbi:acetyltransferase [Candidatus Pelagibacter sp. HIMB1495]|uniref:acetyltransferase n=1 Tax=unclassified Candidatus Pelagibacter TaxID=2647897 RepID=UPI003F835868
MSEKFLIIFGIGQQSDIISFYLNKLSKKIYAYCVDEKFYKKDTFRKTKVITTQDLIKNYKPKNTKMHIAISYKKLNKLRYEKYNYFKKKGYSFENVIFNSSLIDDKVNVGENVVLLDSYIQPYSKVGNNTFIWSGAILGHHSSVGNNCWISSGCTIGGNCKIKDYSFLGLNSTIGHFVTIGNNSFVGSSSHVTKNLSSQSVVIQNDSRQISFDPEKFLEINKFK